MIDVDDPDLFPGALPCGGVHFFLVCGDIASRGLVRRGSSWKIAPLGGDLGGPLKRGNFMKRFFSLAVALVAVFPFADVRGAGGKGGGQSGHVSKSCRSKCWVTLHPGGKFGVCCSPQSLPEVG